MIQLAPGDNFTIVRQIPNHLDSNTKYVRAVVRNAFTDVILETVDLTDKGSNRFKNEWKVPADPSGQGFYISIVTSVYSDSGYTAKDENYGDDENTYLVLARQLQKGGGISKVSGGVDARTVRRILKEELEAIEIALKKIANKKEEAKEPMRWDDILFALGKISRKIDTKKFDIDFSPVIEAIQEKPVTPTTDLTPVIQEVKDSQTLIARLINSIDITGQVSEAVQGDVISKLAMLMKGITFKMTSPTTAEMQMPKEKKVEEPLLDITKLFT